MPPSYSTVTLCSGFGQSPRGRRVPNKPTRELGAAQRLNFLLTNRIPRRCITRIVGWLSRRRQPLLRRLCMGAWQLCAGDLALHEARKDRFESMQDCFTRELRPGARPIDTRPRILTSPCDGDVMACGGLAGGRLLQAKGFPFHLGELLADETLAANYRQGLFVTLRLRASMYHRFHAPEAGRVDAVRCIAGDLWNVNPIAVRCIERLYCRNARAVLPLAVPGLAQPLLLVPVAAIAVASLRIHGLPAPLTLDHCRGLLPCGRDYGRGEEMGYFQQGSTIIVIAGSGVGLAPGVQAGETVRVGRPLLRRLDCGTASPAAETLQ